MKKTLFAFMLTLTDCNASANIPPVITVMHDDAHAVTCWLSSNNGASSIACLPNWMIEDPEDSKYEPEDSAGFEPASATTSILSGEILRL